MKTKQQVKSKVAGEWKDQKSGMGVMVGRMDKRNGHQPRYLNDQSLYGQKSVVAVVIFQL